jgi:hypothetical protein
MPSAKAYFARPGTLKIVGDVVREALADLSLSGIDGVSRCAEVNSVNYEAGWIQFAQRSIPGCKISFELQGA